MGKIFFVAVLVGLSVTAIIRPWVGVVAAYGIAILAPQAVWWWHFEDLRPVLWVLLPTILGFLALLVRREVNWAAMQNKRTFFVFALWMAFGISYLFGPYVEAGGPYRFTDPDWAFSTFNKILLLFFLGCACIDAAAKLRALVYVVIFSAIYLIYWANQAYLSGQVFGRLAGPTDIYGLGTYADENNFAMLFVVAQPFLWYLGLAAKAKYLRAALWIAIPFGWHAVFLTASRGGLIGIAVTTLLIAIRSKSKLLGILLIPALAGAYFFQAGDLMKDRAGTIGEYQTETSASTRLEAWDAAGKMVADHPLTGVGLASFGPAFPDYSDKRPREAHNTFLQITAESGVLAGLMYTLIIAASVVALWRNGNRLRNVRDEQDSNFLYMTNEAVLAALLGFGVCALFLSLQMSEIFYLLCILANAVLFISHVKSQPGTDGSQSRVKIRRPTGAPASAQPAMSGLRRVSMGRQSSTSNQYGKS